MFASERFINESVSLPKAASTAGTALGVGSMFLASTPVALGAALAVPAGLGISAGGDKLLRDRAARGVVSNATGTMSALNKQLQNKNMDISRKNLKVLQNTLSPRQFKNPNEYDKMMSVINSRLGKKNIMLAGKLGAGALGLGAAGLAAYKLYKNRKRKQEEKELQNFNKTNIEQ